VIIPEFQGYPGSDALIDVISSWASRQNQERNQVIKEG
jgi:hypothetical protein